MTEPKRWSAEEPPQAIARLLDAAASEQPSDASLSRSLSALGIGAGALTTAGAAGAATATLAAKTTLLGGGALLKWTLLAVVVGGGVAAERVIRPAAPAAAPQVSVPARAVPPESPRAATPEQISSLVHDTPAPVASAPASRPAPPPEHLRGLAAPPPEPPLDAERLAEEVGAVNRARALLAAGRADEAISALDDYERSFESRRFVPEALYLKMEALLARGELSAAQAVAARLVQRYPNSPQSPRARQVLAKANP